MKKIGFVTINKVLAQGLAATVRNRPDWELEPYLLLGPHQAALDTELLKLDAAVIDVADMALERSPKTPRRAAPPKWLGIPAAINGALAALVFTNDLHHWVLRLDISNPHWSTEYG